VKLGRTERMAQVSADTINAVTMFSFLRVKHSGLAIVWWHEHRALSLWRDSSV